MSWTLAASTGSRAAHREDARADSRKQKWANSAQFWCNVSPFRINTCKSISKQTTLTLFRINTYEKTGEWGAQVTEHRSRSILPYFLCFHTLAHSFAHFCTSEKFNSFLLKQFRTLCQKTPGVGVCPQLFSIFFHGSRNTDHGPHSPRRGPFRRKLNHAVS